MPSDRMVTLKTFANPIEAELAKNRLEADGIPAFLSGEQANSIFGGAVGLTITLLVKQADAERADQILAELVPEDLRHNFLKDAERAAGESETEESEAIKKPEWASTEEYDPDDPEARYRNADTEVRAVGPARKEERIKSDSPAPPPRLNTRVPEKDEDDEPVSPAWKPDDYANRAWKTAVMGLVFLQGILHIYSLYLLFCLMSVDEDLSPAGTKKVYGALVIDALVLGTLALFFLSMLR